MNNLIGLLGEALRGDEVSRAALADVLREAGQEEAADRLVRLLGLKGLVRQRLAGRRESLAALEAQEWSDSVSRLEYLCNDQGAIAAYEGVLSLLGEPAGSPPEGHGGDEDEGGQAESLDGARRDAADGVFAGYDMGDDAVKEAGGWDSDGDEWRSTFSAEGPGGGPSASVERTFVVRFRAHTAQVEEAYVAG